MDVYISFLRGVNMTGHNSIKMAELAGLFSDLGFISPETYIQSGNVVFRTIKSADKFSIASTIERGIMDRFGFNVPAMIRTPDEIRAIMTLNPYLEEPLFDPARMAVILLHDTPSEAQISKVASVDYPPDKFSIIGDEIFTFCPNGFARTKIYTNFFENRMKVTGTARNWKTISFMLNLAEKKK